MTHSCHKMEALGLPATAAGLPAPPWSDRGTAKGASSAGHGPALVRKVALAGHREWALSRMYLTLLARLNVPQLCSGADSHPLLWVQAFIGHLVVPHAAHQ